MVVCWTRCPTRTFASFIRRDRRLLSSRVPPCYVWFKTWGPGLSGAVLRVTLVVVYRNAHTWSVLHWKRHASPFLTSRECYYMYCTLMAPKHSATLLRINLAVHSKCSANLLAPLLQRYAYSTGEREWWLNVSAVFHETGRRHENRFASHTLCALHFVSST